MFRRDLSQNQLTSQSGVTFATITMLNTLYTNGYVFQNMMHGRYLANNRLTTLVGLNISSLQSLSTLYALHFQRCSLRSIRDVGSNSLLSVPEDTFHMLWNITFMYLFIAIT